VIRRAAADAQEHCDVSPNSAQQIGFCFRVESHGARFPIHALEMIHQDCPFYLIYNDRKRERIWFSGAGEGQTTTRPLARL